MRATIHYYNGDYDGFLIIEGDNIEDIREKALYECNRRAWDTWDIIDCWSEVEE